MQAPQHGVHHNACRVQLVVVLRQKHYMCRLLCVCMEGGLVAIEKSSTADVLHTLWCNDAAHTLVQCVRLCGRVTCQLPAGCTGCNDAACLLMTHLMFDFGLQFCTQLFVGQLGEREA